MVIGSTSALAAPPGARADGAIAVLGHYGAGNLGDEAIIEAVLHELRQRWPEQQLVAVSMHPADTAARHGVPAWPVRRTARSGPSEPETTAMPAAAPAPQSSPQSAPDGRSPLPLPRIVKRLLRGSWSLASNGVAELRFFVRTAWLCRRLDLLLITGSNQFLDNFGGAWGYPWTLLKWTLAARLQGVPVAFLGVGAGPLEGRLSRFMVRCALRLSAWHSYRDAASRELVEGAGHDLHGRVGPDLAFALSLAPAGRPSPAAGQSGSGRVIGINVMPVFDGRYWPIDRPHLYHGYVEAVAGLVDHLRATGDRPFLYATQPSDERVIDDVLACMRSPDDDSAERGLVRRADTVAELVALIREADVLVPTRFHGTILALACHRPVLAVCYHRKTADVMATFGLARHALAFEAVTTESLVQGLVALLADEDAVRARIAATADANRALLAAQFDTVVALVAQGQPRTAGARE